MLKIVAMLRRFVCCLLIAFLFSSTNISAESKAAALIESLRAGDMAKARTLISGSESNAVDKKGRTVLSWAAEKGTAEIIALLLKKSARVNERDQEGKTALMYAAAAGNDATAKALIKGKADLNIVDQKGQTALMHAATGGSVIVVGTLVAAGAKASATDYDGKNAAELATGDQREQIVQLLGGEKIPEPTNKIVEKKPETPAQQNPAPVEKPAPSPPQETPAPAKLSPLIEAAKDGDTNKVRSLILSGANVNERLQPDGDTALMWAALKGHAQIVQILMVAGSEPNAQTESGLTALMAASLQGHKEIVQSLLRGGADFNVKRKDGATALMLAEKAGHRDVVDLLRQAGARD